MPSVTASDWSRVADRGSGGNPPSPVLPLTGFAINDGSVVWVETLTGEQMFDDPNDVGTYAEAFDAALAASAVGDAAIEVLHAAQQRLQQQP